MNPRLFPYFTYCLFQRILWFRVAIRLGQVKEVPVYTDKSCTSHTHTSRPLLHHTTDTKSHHNPSIYSSHRQRRRDPSRTAVHRCRNPRNGQLGTKHQRFVRSLLPPSLTSSSSLAAP